MSNDFLDKPFDATDLSRQMGDAASRARGREAAVERAAQVQELVLLLKGLPEDEFARAYDACLSLTEGLAKRVAREAQLRAKAQGERGQMTQTLMDQGRRDIA